MVTTSDTWDAESGTFSYDRNGNLTAAPSPYSITSAAYDYRNLPTTIVHGGTTTNYRYNAAGQRIYKSGSQDEWQVVDGDEVLGVFSMGPTLKWWNIIADGKVIGRYESGTKKYYYTDALGSTRAVVNSSGSVLEAYDYYPFGLSMPGRSAGSGTLERFTGQERDGETGLDYFGARYYMPAYGRWASVDPMADKAPGWSPYSYALNNPARLVDPTGMAIEDEDGCPPDCDDESSLAQQALDRISINTPAWQISGSDVVHTVVEKGSPLAHAVLQGVGKGADVVSDAATLTEAAAVAAAPFTAGATLELAADARLVGMGADFVSLTAKGADAAFGGSTGPLVNQGAKMGLEAAGSLLIAKPAERAIQGAFIRETGPRVSGPAFRSATSGRFISNMKGYAVIAASHGPSVALTLSIAQLLH